MIGEDRERVEHHLREIKVVLIKRMISDQLPYIGVAKKFLPSPIYAIFTGGVLAAVKSAAKRPA